jgi:hypothetical protein
MSRLARDGLAIKSLGPFDRYVVKFFFDGITPDEAIEAESVG